MTQTLPVFYAPPAGEGIPLDMASALAGCDTAGSPSQIRSAAFISAVGSAITDGLRATANPLALRVDLALPDAASLITLHELDNYVFSLVRRITADTGRQFASVWATKRHAAKSSVALGQAHRICDPGGTFSFQVRTTASVITRAYRQQVSRQITASQPLPDGGIALQLSFVVGTRRAWPNLWKATIDSLSAIIGCDRNTSDGRAGDARITDLGLHCLVDPAAGSDVIIAVRARPDTSWLSKK